MSGTRWIVIPNWKQFQHYADRDPRWIKNYRAQLMDDDYRDLSFAQRGLLHGLRLLYAASDGKVLQSTAALTQKLGQRVTTRSLEALNDAGLIAFSASKPLALCYQSASPEQSREEKLKALAKNSNGSVDLPSTLKGEGESAYALVLLLAAVKGTDAVKVQLRSKVEAMALAPYAIHSAREELVKARANGKPIRSEAAYVLAICGRYADLELERKAS